MAVLSRALPLTVLPLQACGLRALGRSGWWSMATVFGTYHDAGQTLPPGVLSVLLTAFDLRAVFLVGGAAVAALAVSARSFPERL